MTDYVKYTRGKIAYYIREQLVALDVVGAELDRVSDISVMQISDFAVDLTKNEFIKCRYPVDLAYDVKPVKVSADKIAQSVETLRDELIAREAAGRLTLGEQAVLFKLNSCLYKEYPHKEHK
jgi:hypothetical protein